MLSAKEERSIRHRLSIGNSPKTIALAYTGQKGILKEIEAIRALMAQEKAIAHLARQQMTATPPDWPVEHTPVPRAARLSDAVQEPWFVLLEKDKQRLITEACKKFGIEVAQVRSAHKGRGARMMIAWGLRHRWAMTYDAIGAVLDISALTAGRLCNGWSGKAPVSSPPVPKISKKIAALLRLTAGEYGTTEHAILCGVGLRGVADRARDHLAYRLYAERGFRLCDIKRWFSCDQTTVRVMVGNHAVRIDAPMSAADEAHARARSSVAEGKREQKHG